MTECCGLSKLFLQSSLGASAAPRAKQVKSEPPSTPSPVKRKMPAEDHSSKRVLHHQRKKHM